MQTRKHWVGIDVCKRWLDLHLRPQGVSFRVPNTTQGLVELSSRLPDASLVGRILLESTGGYAHQAALLLWQLSDPVVVMNARQARNFARAVNQLAKTDTVDAAILAWFGEAIQPQVRPLDSEAQVQLQDLVRRRRQLVEMLTTEQNRAARLRGVAPADVEADLDWLRERIKQHG